MKNKTKKIVALFALLALMFTLAGCNAAQGPAASAPPADTATPSSTQGTSGGPSTDEDTLKIVATIIMNTEYGDRAQLILDNMMEETNAAGGVDGKKVEIEYLDTGSDQQSYINCIQKAINTQGVDAIIGSFYGEYCIAASDHILNAKIPTINLSINNIQLEMNEYYFINRAVTTGVNGSWGQMALDSGMENPVIVCLNTDTGVQTTETLVKMFEDDGKSVAKVIYFDSNTTTDYTPLMLEAMNVAEGDGMILNMNAGDDGQSALDILHQYGYEHPICVCSSMMSTAISNIIGGEAVEGVFGPAEYSSELETAGNTEFVQKLQEWGYTGAVEWTGAAYYDCFKIITEAARLSGETTAQGVYDGFKLLNGLEGAMTTYTYHDDQCFADYIYEARFGSEGNVVLGEKVAVVH